MCVCVCVCDPEVGNVQIFQLCTAGGGGYPEGKISRSRISTSELPPSNPAYKVGRLEIWIWKCATAKFACREEVTWKIQHLERQFFTHIARYRGKQISARLINICLEGTRHTMLWSMLVVLFFQIMLLGNMLLFEKDSSVSCPNVRLSSCLKKIGFWYCRWVYNACCPRRWHVFINCTAEWKFAPANGGVHSRTWGNSSSKTKPKFSPIHSALLLEVKSDRPCTHQLVGLEITRKHIRTPTDLFLFFRVHITLELSINMRARKVFSVQRMKRETCEDISWNACCRLQSKWLTISSKPEPIKNFRCKEIAWPESCWLITFSEHNAIIVW